LGVVRTDANIRRLERRYNISRKLHYIVFPVLLAIANLSHAALTTLDFEDLPGMPLLAPVPIPDESKLSDNYLDEFGVLFSSGSPYVAVTNLGAAATSGQNGILATRADGTRTNTVPISISFFKPGDSAIPFITSSVSAKTDLWGTNGIYSATLHAYDVTGTLLGSASVPDSNGQLLAFSAEGIHRFELSSSAPDTAGIAFDDVTFDSTSPIPIPAAVWLFGSGLLGLIGISRRKKAA
jgi:hypothetical protein